MSRRRKWGQRRRFPLAEIALLAISLVAGLGLMEAGLRLWSPVEMRVKGGDSINLPYFKRYRIENSGNPKLDPVITTSRNSLGFRGAEPPAAFEQALSVVAVGGSTTESFYVSDGGTWPELVGKSLAPGFDRLWVNNAGLMGHSTFGHLVLMRQHVVPLKPKVALFLVGINDRTRTGLNDNEADMQRSRRGAVTQWLLRNSELASLAWNLHRALLATKLGTDATGTDYAALPKVAATPEQAAAALAAHGEDRRAAYADRLRQLVTMSREAGILPVLITQPAVYGPAMDDVTGVDLGLMQAEPVNGAVAWQLLEIYNDVTRLVAAETGTELIELARALPKSTRYYYDLIHFTPAGSAKVAEIVGARLCPVLEKHFPQQRRSGAECPR